MIADFDLQLFNIGSILGTIGNVVAPGIGGIIGSGVGSLFGGGSSGEPAQIGGQIGTQLGAGLQSQALSQEELNQIQSFIMQAYNQQGASTQNALASDNSVISGLNNPAMSGYSAALMQAMPAMQASQITSIPQYDPVQMTGTGGPTPGSVAPTAATPIQQQAQVSAPQRAPQPPAIAQTSLPTAATTPVQTTTAPPVAPNFQPPGSLGGTITGSTAPSTSQATAPSAPTGFTPQQQAAINSATTSIGAQAAGMSDYAITTSILNNLQQTGLFTPQELSQASTAFINPNQGKFSNAATPDQVASWQQQISNPMLAAMSSGGSTIPLGSQPAAPPAVAPAPTRATPSAIPLGRPGMAMAGAEAA